MSVPGGASPTIGSSARCSNTMRGSSRRRGHDRLSASSPVSELGEQPLGRALVHEQLARRARRLREVLDELGHEPPARGADDAEASRCPPAAPAARRAPRAAGRARAGCGAPGRAPPGPTPSAVAPAAAPGEQRDAELGLELADLVGHVRLHRAQRVGGGGERALLVDGDQRVEMAQLHGVPFVGPRAYGSPATGYSSVTPIDAIDTTCWTDTRVQGVPWWRTRSGSRYPPTGSPTNSLGCHRRHPPRNREEPWLQRACQR